MDKKILFAVRRQEIEYKAPAKYGDEIDIKTWVKEYSDVRIQFAYEIKNQDGQFLSKAITDMVCVGSDFKLREMPEDLKYMLKNSLRKESVL